MGGKSSDEQARLLHTWREHGELDPQVAAKVQELEQLEDASRDRKLREIVALLELQRDGEQPRPIRDPVQQAKAIKKSPLYQDPGLKQQTNWLAGAADRLQKIKGPQCDCANARASKPDPSGVAEAFKYIAWTLFGLLLLGFVYFAASRFAWSRRLRRRAMALMEEDEPERTVDEWLQRSDELEREGRYREAIRCLYLACLLKLDEARVAKFERSETNWEHLKRIEASPLRPIELDFKGATQAFDQAWYGMRVRGAEDVARFRTWYQEVTELTGRRAA